MTKGRKIQKVLLVLALIISCVLTCFTNSIGSVYASTIDVVGGYTDVLDDLQQDESFDPEDYPVIEDDYSLQVIQIAESTEREILVYVYQPTGEALDLRATSVFLSTSEKGLDYINCTLTLLNRNGVFYKYRINNLTVSYASTRHYEITSIYRKFDPLFDLEPDNENIIDEVNYEVAKHWTFSNNGDIVCQDIETITITDKYVGLVRYDQSNYTSGLFAYAYPGLDSHYIAFKTDKKIDKLMEADVYYTTQYYHYYDPKIGSPSTSWGDLRENYSNITYKQRVSFEPGGVNPFNYKYAWDRIQSVTDFIATENQSFMFSAGPFYVRSLMSLTTEGLEDLKGMEWILRFTETEWKEYTSGVNMGYVTQTHHEERTIVGDVSILRLKFETDGVVYNLGVLDNKQTGDGIPDNETNTSFGLKEIFELILTILFIILLLVILAPILPTIFNVLWTVLKTIVNIVVWVISLPFKLVNYISDKRKDKKE